MQLEEIISKLSQLAGQANTKYSKELGEDIISTFEVFMERFPNEFYEWYIETISRRSPLRVEFDRLIHDGLVTESTTWTDLAKLLGVVTSH